MKFISSFDDRLYAEGEIALQIGKRICAVYRRGAIAESDVRKCEVQKWTF